MHTEMLAAWKDQRPYQGKIKMTDKVASIDAFPKLYNYPRAVSRFILTTDHTSSYNNFQLSSPMGVGLGIEKQDNGHYVAITAGTGIVPMMDLVCYLFRKNLTEAASGKGVAITGFEDERFDLLGDNFHLELWATFAKREEVVALELLQTLEELSEKGGFNNFKLRLRISSEGDPRWDQDFVQMNMNTKAEGVFVRGPQDFNQRMEEYLVKCGYDVEKILHI